MKKAAKDQAILEAAEDEFLSKGFLAAAMETIARRACVSKATLYKYYPSKDDLFEALINKLFTRVKSIHDFDQDTQLSLDDVLRLATKKLAAFISEPNFLKLARILMIEMIKSPDINSKFKKRLNEEMQWFTRIVQRCQDNGSLTTAYPAEDISRWFQSVIDGLLLWPMMVGIKTELTEADVEECYLVVSKHFMVTFQMN